MEIVSTLLPPDGSNHAFMAFDTLVDGRSFVVALAVGDIERGEPRLTPTGRACCDHALAHSHQQYPGSTVHFVEVRRFNHAAKRVRQAFTRAQHGDTVLFVCGDNAIYDEVFKHLNLQARSGLLTKH